MSSSSSPEGALKPIATDHDDHEMHGSPISIYRGIEWSLKNQILGETRDFGVASLGISSSQQNKAAWSQNLEFLNFESWSLATTPK